MSNKKVWFITGAGRGMGVDFAKAALGAGHAVVASGRDRDAVSKALGRSDDLLTVKLDVTKLGDAEAAVRAAVDRFGRIEVLVNNAASFYAGYFEELTPEQIGRQLATSLIGPMNVTRAVLPVMRKQRSGLIISISSLAGLVGFEFGTAYAASKFGLEGWMASLHAEVAPFGITTTVVNPGFFRTELLSEQSTNYAEPSIEDYGERRAKQLEFWTAQNGQQAGDPAKLVKELRGMNVTPHVAQNTARPGESAIDGRTSRHAGYQVSQKRRKIVEEVFGWMKTVGGQRKTKYRGLWKVGWIFTFAAAAYNLVRKRTLTALTAEAASA